MRRELALCSTISKGKLQNKEINTRSELISAGVQRELEYLKPLGVFSTGVYARISESVGSSGLFSEDQHSPS